MTTINLSVDIKGASARMQKYSRKQLPAAVSRALNRTLRGMVTDTKRTMSKKIGMTQANVGKRLISIKSSKKTGTLHKVTMKVRGEKRVPNLGSFRPTRSKRGVRARVWEKKMEYKRSFIWERQTKGGTSAVTVLRRDKNAKPRLAKQGRYAGTKSKRQPLIPTFGTSLRRAFVQVPKRGKSAKAIIIPLARARFRVELDRQLARIN